MQLTSHAPGSFCWFELATTDQAAAKQFYSALFGWDAEDTPMGPGEFYTMFRRDGGEVGAAYTMRPEERAQGVPPHWLLYIAASSADETARRAEALGATVLAPAFDVAEFGRMSVIQDPAGATFAVWQAAKNIGVTVKNEMNTVSWADLSTPKQADGASFYTQLFGWKMLSGKDNAPAAPGDYYHIVNNDEFIGGIPPSQPANVPPHWMIYVEVADCAASVATASSLGANVVVGTMTIGENGSMAILADPQGAVFALHQSK